MLQINTGKLYARGVGRINRLTGVLYANVRLPYGRDIVTTAGTLRSAGSGPPDFALVYNLEERIEATDLTPGVLVSQGVGPFLDDFAVVASFGLRSIFSREPETVRALTGGRAGFSSYDAPDKFVGGFFDRSIDITNEQAEDFIAFVEQLLSLERRSFLSAMRSMRTFVAGLHRIHDDLALAYTLIVSSLESLAQEFDDFKPAWSDVDDRKRHAIDAALANVTPSHAAAVRVAILDNEHVALARRYRAFVQSHVGADYFRREDGGFRPVARHELDTALRQAYGLRSAYIHRLRSLPDPIAAPHGHFETTTVERRPALTFQGLIHLTRHVIKAFVAERPKVERETYDYTLEQAGIISGEWAPQYWVGHPMTDPTQARRRLEGMLGLVASVLGCEPDAKLVDLRPMLADVERLLPQAAAAHRPALLAVHVLFNLMVHADQRTPGFEAFVERYGGEASAPSVESLLVWTTLNSNANWSVQDHQAMATTYFAERSRPTGLHAPRLLEAATCLALAEKHRVAGDDDSAKQWIAQAVEAHPAHTNLRAFEATYVGQDTIDWQVILGSKEKHPDGESPR